VINARGDLLRRPKIVILGAGFGGLMTVTRLQKELEVNEAEIVLITNTRTLVTSVVSEGVFLVLRIKAFFQKK
jgi:NADH dehydrogenase FAD-containing subunit